MTQQDFIQPGNTWPHSSYLVCATPRSGSNFLCAALRRTGFAGDPEEYFGHRDQQQWAKYWGPSASYQEHFRKAVRRGTTPNGVCGAKLFLRDGFHEEYLSDFNRKLEPLLSEGLSSAPVLERIASVFPNCHFIWLTRRHKIRQAVSFQRAIQTKMWHDFEAGPEAQPAAREPSYDYNGIEDCLVEVVRQEAEWQDLFSQARIQPLTVVYEDLAANFSETINYILRYLKIEAADTKWPEPRMRKQSDGRSELWCARFCAERSQRLSWVAAT
jgi:trehalose 2-sulfotransferase